MGVANIFWSKRYSHFFKFAEKIKKACNFLHFCFKLYFIPAPCSKGKIDSYHPKR